MPTIADVRQQYPQYNDMSDADLAGALHTKFYSDMPKEEFSAKIGLKQSSASDAITDVPKEITSAYQQAAQHLTGNSVSDIPGYDPRTRGQLGPIEGLMRTGKQLLGLPEVAISPVVGAARSLIGHPMAQAEHAVGSLIAPDIAAKDDPQKMYETAKGDVDTALSALGTRGPVAAKAVAATGPELKAAAQAVYNSPAIKAIDIPSTDVTALASKIENSLVERGNRPTAGNAPSTMAEVKNLYPGDGVESVKVDDLRSARRALNITAKQRDPLTGAPTPDAEAAMHSIGHLDGFIDTIAPELKTANANYAAAKGADRLDYRMAKAEHRAARTGIGGNLENVMRQEADKIPNSGLTAEEQATRDQIVLGSPLRNTLRTAGKLGVDGGLSLMLHTGAAVGTGGTTIPVTVAGTIARKFGEFLTRRQMGLLSEQIRARAPLSSSMDKFDKSATAFLGAKNPQTYAAAVLAARNFSTNLKDAGINLSPGDLLRGLQSPASSQAQDQQEVPRPPGQ